VPETAAMVNQKSSIKWNFIIRDQKQMVINAADRIFKPMDFNGLRESSSAPPKLLRVLKNCFYIMHHVPCTM
jgi:hypothetical protein